MSVGTDHPRSPIEHGLGVTILPTSTLGRWALVLAGASLPLVFTAALVPRGAALGFACGVAGGAAALTAIIRDRDRAVTVFAAVLPLVVAVAFVLVEVITGLDQ
jgi:hypothetical protein